MSDRFLPDVPDPRPQGTFETLMSWGQKLPGKPGHICNRKLKRRLCARTPDSFAKVVADLRPGDLCIDLGANVGEVTQTLAATGAEVISFEPAPETFAILQQNVGSLDNVFLHKKAVGAKTERLTLHRNARWDPSNPLRRSAASSIVHDAAGMSDAHAVMVDVIDFPAFLTDLDRDIRLIKMDIEGAEWDLLDALLASPVLDRIDCMFVETHERVDPGVNIKRFDRLRARAAALARPRINLFWH